MAGLVEELNDLVALLGEPMAQVWCEHFAGLKCVADASKVLMPGCQVGLGERDVAAFLRDTLRPLR